MRGITFVKMAVLSLVICLFPIESHAAYVKGEFSGFDIRNFTGSQANDFELILSGLSCDDFSSFVGYKTESPEETWDAECEDLSYDRVRIRWTGPAIDDEEWMHFGFELKSGDYDIDAETATWTLDGEMTGEMGYLYQDWQGFANCSVGDYIEIPGESPPLVVERRWAPSDVVYPLADLNVFNPSIQNLNWSSPEYLIANPGDVLELIMQSHPGDRAILIYYTVKIYGSNVITQYYLNQAKIRRLPFPVVEEMKQAEPVDVEPVH